MLLCPLADSIEVPTGVSGIEIDVCLWGRGIPPHLAEDADVDGTHQLLAENVEAVSWPESVSVKSEFME